MPAMWIMGGAQLLGAFNSAQQAQQQAVYNASQFRWDEYNRVSQWADASWMQTLNNAERWSDNRAIAANALAVRERTKFWDRVRFENTSSQTSKQMLQAYSNLGTALGGRMASNSATSRAILRSSMDNYFEARKTMLTNEALKASKREDVYQQALGRRDFGFTPISEHYASQYHGASPGDAYQSALMAGIAGGTAAVAGAHIAAGD